MWPVILRLVIKGAIIGVGGYIVKEIFTSSEDDSENGVNCHDVFSLFHENISIPKGKIQKLIQSRKALEKRIVDHFRLMGITPLPKFYIQGSYKMGTIVLTKDGTYDVDLGVYFLKKPNIEPSTLQKWVLEALIGQTTGGVQHRSKCIRVVYQGDFDIDLPVYYKGPSDMHPYLATKNSWIENDPKELCDWFDSKIDDKKQLIRLVKYFKVWANKQSRKMPSGIAFTVWVANYYKPHKRDDISFYKTAKAIKDSFGWDVTCKNPATPQDDLTSKLTDDQKTNFEDEFSKLINACEETLTRTTFSEATRGWKKVFGNRFPITEE